MSEAVGAQLRAARESRGWSVDEVAGRLRIPVRYVTALEAGDAAALPEPTFVRGYVKAYAKALGLDVDALLAAVVQVEVRAPRPLIGPEGQAGASRRATAPVRGPSFRSGSSRRYPMYIGGLVLAAGLTWLVWPDAGERAAVPPAAVPSSPAPSAPPALPPAGNVPPSVAGGVTLAVPLPGAAVTQPAAPAGGQITAAAPGAQAPSATVLPAATAAQARPAASPAVVAGPATEAAPVAPRKGLFARFSGTCWLEVRDADNVVIHTRIAMAGNEVSVDGKAPLTVTLGDASAAEVWYNGDRVAADKFSSNGIARIIVGQSAR